MLVLYSLQSPSHRKTQILLLVAMTRQRPQRARWSMFPSMHADVSRLLEVENLYFAFHDLDEDVDCIRTDDTNIMGRFSCYNKRCQSNGWPSMRISITIRMYRGE